MTESRTHSTAVLHAIGTTLVIKQRPTPSPGPEEVLLRNRAIGLNPIDWKVQAAPHTQAVLPLVMGSDVSGVVAEVGSSVKTVKPGDRVLGAALVFLTGNHDHAAYQEYTILRVNAVVPLPETISFGQGAALPTAVATATMVLFESLGLSQDPAQNSGTPILIWGGGSTVGSMAVQFAHLFGLVVYTAASERHHSRLRELGAAIVVDYNSPTAVDDLISAAERAGTSISHAFDAISVPETALSIIHVLSKSSAATKKLVVTPSPALAGVEAPDGIDMKLVNLRGLSQVVMLKDHEWWQLLATWDCQPAGGCVAGQLPLAADGRKRHPMTPRSHDTDRIAD